MELSYSYAILQLLPDKRIDNHLSLDRSNEKGEVYNGICRLRDLEINKELNNWMDSRGLRSFTIVSTSIMKQVMDKLEKYIISIKVFESRWTPLKTLIIAV